MRLRAIPGTDLRLSAVGVGCWAMGGMWWGDDVDDDRSTRAIWAALDCGINWFDTAPLYGHGRADAVLARALGPRIGEVTIATKVGVRVDGEHAESDLTPEHVAADTEASLRRLGVEAIDLLQIHWPCERGTPLADTLGALVRLKEQGKVRHIGLCNYGPEALRQAAAIAPIAVLQTPYSLLRREFEAALMPTCRELGVGSLAYEPLCRGLLTGKFRSIPRFPESDLRSRDERFQGRRFGHARRLVQDLERVGQRLGVPTAAVALGWAARRTTAVIAGAKSPEQVRENAAAMRSADSEKIGSVIDRIAAIHGGM